ncbi:oligopeptide/dipeptide ABC transporter ATP-binding protein [Variovorax sp. PCZ-1]|uniref:oligopeptide/dipeptide ABC transporter ATP-binding protein n=1 Tax=Variovorax sp. PCZ-1 TaxID=2835533 RepID=UPI001BCCAFB7|nr:oligopeptide/dipeptide ABC transporter ATP-binding protein [Variovorax sp. PCZ-1]MBS7806381.1 ATP-binding cassette domain-containing protein [Variovorax sp. PCZ-1]
MPWRQPMLEVRDLKVEFKLPADSLWPWAAPHILRAVDGVSLDLQPGETLGIVGESGCGKSTLARGILSLVPVASGHVRWQGQDLAGLSESVWLSVRRDIQMIFQDPLASLNPRMTVMQLIAEPLRTHEPHLPQAELRERVVQVMQQVGLSEQQINRYPHEFSGGQCQRIGIARALILKPKLIICDEPVSALDVSIQAQIINLLKDLQQSMGLTLIFIAHNLAVVKHISDRVMVMYLGRAVELADTRTLFAQPQHPYTQALLAAIPEPDPKLERVKKLELLQGDLPSPLNPPSGCRFRTRCPKAQLICAEQLPPLRSLPSGTQAACTLL